MKIHLVGLFVLTLLVFSSCEDDPSSVGQDLLADQDIAKFYNVDSNVDNMAISTSTFIGDIKYGSSRRTLVGSFENMKATAALRFEYPVPDSVKDAIALNELTVEDSFLEFYIDYNFGDENISDVFSINRILNEWTATDFDRASLSNIEFENVDIGTSYDFSNDTTVSVNLDKQVSFEWLSHSADTNNFSNYGLLLNPVENSNRIIGLAALSSSVNADKLPSLNTIIRFSNGDIDTITASLRLDAFAVEGELPTINNSAMLLQGGLPVRSSLKFDLSILPQTSVVVNAELSLQYDEVSSMFGSSGSDSLFVSLFKEGEEMEIDSSVFSLILKRDSSSYSGDIKSFIQLWTDEKVNNGMQIRLSDEDRAVSKLTLYNENSTAALKPHLKIIYTDIK